MAVDKNYLKESNLENVYKRMRQINEYVITHGTAEADDMDQQQPDMGGMPGGDPNTEAQPPQGGQQMPMDNGGGQMPPADMGGQDMGQMPMDDGGAQMPAGDPNADQMNAQPQPDPTIGAEADTMAGDMGGVEDVDMEGDSDDEVIDVDDLTNSQEAAEYKIDGVDDKLSKLLMIAGKFAQAIQDNDAKLNDLKAEIERRNPTDTEKINIRSQNSKPFSVNPGEYWDEVKANNPNYQVIADNEVSPNDEDKVYTITDDDLNNFNSAEVEKSFSDFPKDLMDYFK